jgi:hypothetical protein
MGKLHELIAVEPDLKDRAIKSAAQVGQAFQNTGKFLGQTRKYTPANDGGQQLPFENKEVETSVAIQLARLRKDFGAWVDAAVQKEVTNTTATSKVVIGGTEYTLPATALLNLENKLSQLRGVYAAIPTNDTSERWHWDEAERQWVSDPVETIRTSKKAERFVKYDATKEHPAQVDIIQVDVRDGTWATNKRSGMMAPAKKQEYLDRLDDLLLTVKKARQRANDVDADTMKISEALFKHIES